MTTTKSTLTLDEQLTKAIHKKNFPAVRLECDANGNLIVDKEKHPEIHDWLTNG